MRFLVDVALADGTEVTAHTANPGAMEGLLHPGAAVWLEPAAGAKRKLPYTWVAVEHLGVRVGVDTIRPNALVREMLLAKVLPGLGRYRGVTSEFVHAPGSRVDFRLDTARGPHDIEVKNCHLVYPDRRGYFPDSVSERAARHMRVLEAGCRAGHRCSVLFVVQREDAVALRPSDAHDPEFAAAARSAKAAGVRFLALRARPTDEGLEALGAIPVEMEPYDLEFARGCRVANKPFSGWIRPVRSP